MEITKEVQDRIDLILVERHKFIGDGIKYRLDNMKPEPWYKTLFSNKNRYLYESYDSIYLVTKIAELQLEIEKLKKDQL